MLNRGILTLTEFTIRDMQWYPAATGELAGLIRDIALAGKRVNAAVNKAGLTDISGDSGTVNVHDEDVKKLDIYANEQFTNVLMLGKSCAGIASEELPEIIGFDDAVSRNSKYVCMFDPLDGSSNIDVNVSIGTIFGIYRRVTKQGTQVGQEDFLQPGNRQVAAGYIIYGSSTMFVYATSKGVNGFTLDPSIGEFCLSYPDIKCPEAGTIYSVNHGNFSGFEQPVKDYIQICQQKGATNGMPYTQRYIGSLVCDIHRNLMKGGIFMYPATSSMRQGKLRLLYECNPFAFIIEKAGGIATDGYTSILEKKPIGLHDRTPLFLGSRKMMAELGECWTCN